MITEKDYDLIRHYLETNSLYDWDDPRSQRLVELDLIRLVESNQKRKDGYTSFKVRLSLSGEDAVLEFEKKRDQDAKQERDRRFNKKLAILNALVPFITFILGLLVEHYVNVFAFFASLFR